MYNNNNNDKTQHAVVSGGIRLVRVLRKFLETMRLFFETFSARAGLIFLHLRWASTPSLCVY